MSDGLKDKNKAPVGLKVDVDEGKKDKDAKKKAADDEGADEDSSDSSKKKKKSKKDKKKVRSLRADSDLSIFLEEERQEG